jgi:nitrogen PTS system EIIA component
MKITDILQGACVTSDLEANNKEEVIEELVEFLLKNKKITDKKKIVNILVEREKLGSTGIGYGIAIPHGKSDHVDKLVAVFGRSKKGVDFDSLDGESVHLFFLLITPEKEASGLHLKALARISTLLKDKLFRQQLLNAKNAKEIFEFIKKEDNKKDS